MSEFAAKTTVAVEKTKVDIETLVRKRYGAEAFGVATENDQNVVMFRVQGIHVRFLFSTPALSEYEFTAQKKRRTSAQQVAAWQQAERTLWRGVLDLIQAKFVAVEKKIRTVEEEFFGDIVLENNQTMRQWAAPYIQASITQGKVPPLLPGGKDMK